MSEFHASRLKGKFLTYVARGDASVPLEHLAKEVLTYLSNTYITVAELSAIIDEVRLVGVEGFHEWRDYEERNRRFRNLAEALLVHVSGTAGGGS